MPAQREPSERTVIFDSGWMKDGHTLCWDEKGTWIIHPDGCPMRASADGTQRDFFCSPGIQDDTYSVSLADLPYDEWERVENIERPTGSVRIEWRVREVAHPDLTDAQHEAIRKFDIRLAR